MMFPTPGEVFLAAAAFCAAVTVEISIFVLLGMI